ncbi:MAG: hypothetical protein ACAI38_15735 [Myxococcota bacterium]
MMKLIAVAMFCSAVLASGAAAGEKDEQTPPSGGLWGDQDGDKKRVDDSPSNGGAAIIPSQDISKPTGGSADLVLAPPQEEPFDALPAVRVYGLIKPTAIYTFRGMESFSQPNASAISAAGNPVTSFVHDQGRFSMQIVQSRFGIAVNENGHFRGVIEVDFWDNTKPTPIINAFPRLRIAKVTWAPSKAFAIELGQDFDLHAPLSTHTYNFVGGLYQAGNTGFFRQQLKLVFRPERFDLGVAIGFQGGNNAGGRDGPLELSRFPTFAARLAIVDEDLTLGVSGIATQLIFNKDRPDTRRAMAMAGAVYFTINPSDSLDVRVEGYLGRNNANIGLLALGFGRGSQLNPNGTVAVPAADLDEYGGFVSVRGRFSMHHALYAIAGMASIVNRDDVLPNYTRDASNTVVLTNGTTGPGIKHNVCVRLGYELRPTRYFAYVIEGMAYDTLHVLRPEDAIVSDAHQRAYGVESGFLLTF